MTRKVKGRLRPKRDLSLEREHMMREPKPLDDFARFVADLSDDEQPFALKLWQMSCDHYESEVLAVGGDGQPRSVKCLRCGRVRKWMGSDMSTKLQEWNDYCPDGFDMFEWQELYIRDRRMWRFLHDEALASMVEGVEL